METETEFELLWKLRSELAAQVMKIDAALEKYRPPVPPYLQEPSPNFPQTAP